MKVLTYVENALPPLLAFHNLLLVLLLGLSCDHERRIIQPKPGTLWDGQQGKADYVCVHVCTCTVEPPIDDNSMYSV